MRSCTSAASAASFKLFTAPSSSDTTARLSSINGVELWNSQPETRIEFSSFRLVGNANLPNPVSLRRNHAHAFVSASSCVTLAPQVELEFKEDDDQVRLQLMPLQDSSWTVQIRLQLQRECRFGEQFLVVGDHPTMGLWSPLGAAPMIWSNGHVWTAELDLPVDQLIQFKFILREASGKIMWQPGANRILQTRKTSNMIRVLGDWENATVQHMNELMIDEMRQLKPLIKGYNGNVASFKGQAMAMVGENITYDTVEDGGYRSKNVQVERTVEISGNGVAAKKVVSHSVEDEIAVSNKGLRRRKNIVDVNGETHPVLVPELTTCLNVATEEKAKGDLDESSKKYSEPKLDQKQEEKEEEEEEEEAKRYQAKEEGITELIFNKEHAQFQHLNKLGYADSDEPHQGLQLTVFREWNNKDDGFLFKPSEPLTRGLSCLSTKCFMKTLKIARQASSESLVVHHLFRYTSYSKHNSQCTFRSHLYTKLMRFHAEPQ